MDAGQSSKADDTGAGAAEALFSNEPLIVNSRKLMDTGHFAEARALLDNAPANLDALAQELREIMDRIEIAYRTSPEQLLQKVRQGIPDANLADLKRWTDAGGVQFRTIDSQLRYFNREPANIYRFCDEARKRRNSEPPKPKHDLVAHLKQIVEAAERSKQTLVVPIDHVVDYSVTIDPSVPGFRRGEQIRAWLPFPQELDQQTNVRLLSASPATFELSPAGTPQRSIYFQSAIADDSPTFTAKFAFRTFARYPAFDDDRAEPAPPELATFCKERPPHISFTPRLLSAAREAVGGEQNPLRKARRIYDFVVQNIAYAAEEEYGTIASLPEKALITRRGDCGVQAMLFIALCRASGIPARWQSGFQTRPDMEDMHDWAEFYVAPYGWLPADPSYGDQADSDVRIQKFYFGHLDSYRLVVNSDYGRQLHPRKSLLRSEPLDFQRGEIELGKRNLYFLSWSWNLGVHTNSSHP